MSNPPFKEKQAYINHLKQITKDLRIDNTRAISGQIKSHNNEKAPPPERQGYPFETVFEKSYHHINDLDHFENIDQTCRSYLAAEKALLARLNAESEDLWAFHNEIDYELYSKYEGEFEHLEIGFNSDGISSNKKKVGENENHDENFDENKNYLTNPMQSNNRQKHYEETLNTALKFLLRYEAPKQKSMQHYIKTAIENNRPKLSQFAKNISEIDNLPLITFTKIRNLNYTTRVRKSFPVVDYVIVFNDEFESGECRVMFDKLRNNKSLRESFRNCEVTSPFTRYFWGFFRVFFCSFYFYFYFEDKDQRLEKKNANLT